MAEEQDHDPFEDWREWLDHRYDPGYFLGGRIHPMFRVKRPSPFGWIFLVFGAFSLASSIVALREISYLAIPSVAMSFLWILAGSAMLTEEKRRSRDETGHHGQSE
ncbi:MAG: DUF308 domain-containing protein [Acidobacteriia bacterium]|nr:DUF308 domain-containing protein [Terriglobia bacterium]